jgi:3-oxoacyl-[acyl-carrier protein] reductase
MELGISGRAAMVAAASKGIGRASAEALEAAGCRVSVCARDVASVTWADLAVAADVSVAADLGRAVHGARRRAVARRRRLDAAQRRAPVPPRPARHGAAQVGGTGVSLPVDGGIIRATM